MTSNRRRPARREWRAHGACPPLLSRRSVLVGAGALVLTLAACSDDEETPVTVPSPPRDRPLEHGVFLPGGPLDRSAVGAYRDMIDSSPQWIMVFRDWTHETPPLQVLDAALAQGATPVLAWEPWYAPPPQAVLRSAPRTSHRSRSRGSSPATTATASAPGRKPSPDGATTSSCGSPTR